MTLSAEQIRGRVKEFAAEWGGYQGSEVGGAHTFLDDLLRCYGTKRKDVATFEERTGAGGFIDMIWPGVCLVEMKRPSEVENLAAHRQQALGYWQEIGTQEQPAPPWVVLCAFHRFEVWKPGEVYAEPMATFDLANLPEHLDALLFLAGREPGFFARDELTREAVGLVTDAYKRLDEREAADDDVLRDFILQCVWSMFAEDLGMLPSHIFTRLLDGLLKDKTRSSFDDVGRLFRYLAEPGPRPTHGAYAGTPYANGGLFESPAEVHLEPDEVEAMRQACDFDWTQVEPAIFGALLTGGLGKEKQWALGAHYTSEADILKVILPTVVEPWRERVKTCETISDVQAAQADLMGFVVLDPACGSGNFLYVAYRELRRVERDLRQRAAEIRKAAGLPDQEEMALFPITNMRGIEIEVFAVSLARLTMWIGHKLAVDELGVDEPVLPLVDLSGIQRADALAVDWPAADAIVTNPPYHGSQMIRRELGDEYAEWLKGEFGIGLKDYAVYWIRKAHEDLGPGGRAGVVATNSVSQGRSRDVSLSWVIENGGVITNAVSKQPWSGEASVNVSILNWVKDPSTEPELVVLDGVSVERITAALTAEDVDVSAAEQLLENRGRAFQGPIPADNGGFQLTGDEAGSLLDRADADYRLVVRPYLTSDDIGQRPGSSPSRFVIDFGVRPLEEAMKWPAALEIVEERVRPYRATNNRELYRRRWWLFAEPRRNMRTAVAELDRFIAGTRHGTRLHFCWCDPWILASDATNIFAFDDEFSFGVLSSAIHHHWAWAQSGTIKTDIRYSLGPAFGTFPFPPYDVENHNAIAVLASGIVETRHAICAERQIGLTTLYNEVDQGAYAELRGLHRSLDRAVAEAYGWPAAVAEDPDESNRRLLELNLAVAAGEVEYAPFAAGH